jgi:hypothetical protein
MVWILGIGGIFTDTPSGCILFPKVRPTVCSFGLENF